jgi:hypothetical protein
MQAMMYSLMSATVGFDGYVLAADGTTFLVTGSLRGTLAMLTAA